MEKDLRTYYDFADNTYHFLINAYEQDFVANAMGAMAQEVCEKYLKHLIEEYIVPKDLQENSQKTEILRTHNLSKLSKYINNYLPEVKLNRQALNLVNGLYFTTRYPGDESIVVEKEDLKEYIEVVKECKRTIDEFIEKQKK
ncbi:HEPN domain-containing protein [Murimonas intestini]|uniref:HEPN domain-containing protein n=1 Tax=Murimonas intestini TaxID=1337051 RepID=A0AB73T6M3_9FIRM|nr:HEPN domain-containing protein [Murimonas intestini]MCR1839578.1 HEPN domain-containing protein [Murimonas intestini]MCR1866421.1 HEPN domain-containing protein [Murimonas intestini]MCR1882461.1 HEPN domain-containing protein [Murimonas intestini]